jgi:nitrous oxidase accessory protein
MHAALFETRCLAVSPGSAGLAVGRGLLGALRAALLITLLVPRFVLAVGDDGLPAELQVAPGSGTLQAALMQASAGDTVRLQAGEYFGPVTIGKSVTLIGGTGSVVDAGGRGRVITVSAADVVIRNVTVRGSGKRLDLEDAGIFVTDSGDRVLIEANRLEGNLIGVYLKGPDDAVVRDNVIIGNRELRVNERGNGVHLWNTPGSIIVGNTLQYGRDGIYVMASNNNVFRNNRITDMRYAIHYMYTHDSEIIANESLRNNSAFVVMYSERLQVSDNLSDGDSERGLFLNATNNSSFSNNVVKGGAEKCVFIYNANMNVFTDNYFADCDIGIHFTASQGDVFSGNTFLGNRTQVKYVGTRHIELSVDGRGNYWSDNPSFDLNNDGIADRQYRPNDMVDQLLWKHPLAKLLINTPAMELLRWAQSEFPTVFPGGVVDSAPLMQSSAVALPAS